MGSFSHAARGRRFPGPVVHPRVAVPPQRCSWLSTGKRGDHDVATGDPEPQPLLGWHDSFSALQPDQRRDLCRLCLLERPTPTCVFSYQKNRHGPAASACKLKVWWTKNDLPYKVLSNSTRVGKINFLKGKELLLQPTNLKDNECHNRTLRIIKGHRVLVLKCGFLTTTEHTMNRSRIHLNIAQQVVLGPQCSFQTDGGENQCAARDQPLSQKRKKLSSGATREPQGLA
jgi:hypothetical protein